MLSLLLMCSPITTYAEDENSVVVEQNEDVEMNQEETAENEYQSLGNFKLTAYCGCKQCNGKWSGHPTSLGTICTEGRTIAVDRHVIPLGTQVEINIPGEGWHTYIAEDTGGAIKGHKIDIFVNGHGNCYNPAYNCITEVRIKNS